MFGGIELERDAGAKEGNGLGEERRGCSIMGGEEGRGRDVYFVRGRGRRSREANGVSVAVELMLTEGAEDKLLLERFDHLELAEGIGHGVRVDMSEGGGRGDERGSTCGGRVMFVGAGCGAIDELGGCLGVLCQFNLQKKVNKKTYPHFLSPPSLPLSLCLSPLPLPLSPSLPPSLSCPYIPLTVRLQ